MRFNTAPRYSAVALSSLPLFRSCSLSDPSPKEAPPPFLAPEFLQELGNLVAYWAYLESAVEHVIWGLIGIPRKLGVALTTHIGMVSRCHMLGILAERQFPANSEILSDLTKLLDDIESARVKRNDLVHAFWKHDPTGTKREAEALKITARGQFKETHRVVPISEIKSLVDDVWELTTDLYALAKALIPDEEAPSSHKDDVSDS